MSIPFVGLPWWAEVGIEEVALPFDLGYNSYTEHRQEFTEPKMYPFPSGYFTTKRYAVQQHIVVGEQGFIIPVGSDFYIHKVGQETAKALADAVRDIAISLENRLNAPMWHSNTSWVDIAKKVDGAGDVYIALVWKNSGEKVDINRSFDDDPFLAREVSNALYKIADSIQQIMEVFHENALSAQ